MDFSESNRIVIDRIQKLDPVNCSRIIGYLLLQGLDEHQMAEWAMSPDVVIQEVIYEAKVELRKLALKKPTLTPISCSINSPPWINISDLSSQMSGLLWDTQPCSVPDRHIFCLEEKEAGLKRNPRYHLDNAFQYNEFLVKTCYYFNKGICKHGNNCGYFHGLISESFPQNFGHNCDDHSLEKLEMEIIELLKSRRGAPVSIASLPTIYFEKYGKNLQAEGYLTESQRHGKAGYSLTKLLAKLKHSIRLIDRPHGQHSVILAEDAPKYMESRNERNDPGPIVSGSRQLYLTFPADSTFTEDDVTNYFTTYGPVEDVRIPCQQERMYGFVTFVSSDTVQTILSKGKPHFVCGARVLVKPYREKSKLVDRKYREKYDSYANYTPHYVDMDFAPKGCNPRLMRTRHYLMEERERAFEFERKRLAELQFSRKSFANYSYVGHSMDCLKTSEDHLNFPSAERYNNVLDVLNTGSAEEEIWQSVTTPTDQDSDVLTRSDSLFASSFASGI